MHNNQPRETSPWKQLALALREALVGPFVMFGLIVLVNLGRPLPLWANLIVVTLAGTSFVWECASTVSEWLKHRKRR